MLVPLATHTVYAPHLGRNIVLGGRRKTLVPRPALRAARFLRASVLPVTPASCDYSPKALASLTNVYDNNTLGDCVIACGYHAVGTWTGNSMPAPFVATNAQILAMYSAIGGYVIGNPATDQGCSIQTALDAWTATGFADGSRLVGSLAVNPTNQQEVQSIVYLTETLIIGVDLPDAWTSNLPSSNGFVWDVAGPSNPASGHCFLAVGYNAQGLIICTWGLLGILTWAALAKYASADAAGDCFAALDQDIIVKASGISPDGLAWGDLVGAFDAWGGSIPAPTPTALPTPASGSAVTLQQAQSWAAAGIAGGAFLMTKSQATALASAGLSASWPS